MESVQTVDVSWLHHSQKGKSLITLRLEEPSYPSRPRTDSGIPAMLQEEDAWNKP